MLGLPLANVAFFTPTGSPHTEPPSNRFSKEDGRGRQNALKPPAEMEAPEPAARTSAKDRKGRLCSRRGDGPQERRSTEEGTLEPGPPGQPSQKPPGEPQEEERRKEEEKEEKEEATQPSGRGGNGTIGLNRERQRLSL